MKMRFAIWMAIAVVALTGTAFAEGDPNLAALVTAENVKAALLEKGGREAVPIVVTIDRETAILTGVVETKVIQELAAEVALSVDGVDEVDNRLRVAGEKKLSQMSPAEAAKHDEQELADARLESSAKIALYKEIGIRASKIEVEAVEGVVSLRGTLPDESRRKIALDTVGRMKDVKKVIDLIKVD